MQGLNQQLAARPWLNFVNATLRGVGQVIFANNPVTGLIILVAMFIQAPWLGLMSLCGVAAATLTAMALRLSHDMTQNGVFGLNGLLIGAAMGFTGRAGNGPWNPTWILWRSSCRP
jgi:urea transporter